MINDIDIYEEISKNIKKYRKYRNLKQWQLAEKTNFSHEYIRRIESRKGRKNFSVYTVYIISLALNIPIHLFFIFDD